MSSPGRDSGVRAHRASQARSEHAAYPKCAWKPSEAFEGRVTRSDTYTNYHPAGQNVMHWGDTQSVQEVRGEGLFLTPESKINFKELSRH